MTSLRSLVAVLCLIVAGSLQADDGAKPNVAAALDSVAWIGPGVSLADLRGKSVVVLTYVTWCPLCNEWSPEMFRQVREAAAGQPAVVVAVCTDAPTVPGPRYVSEHGLVGRNIVHAYDGRMDEKLGLKDSQLFNALVLGPDGSVVWQGASGRHYPQGDGSRKYAVAEKLREAAPGGKFTIVSPDMPADVQAVLWPMEMGRIVPDRDLTRAKRSLSAGSRAALDRAVESFVARQWSQIEDLSAGEIPQQMTAYAKADLLAKAYRTTEEGRQARSLVGQLNRDTQFKREIAARRTYEQILAKTANQSHARQRAVLEGFAKRFDGTYFAEQARALTAKDDAERKSVDAEAISVP